MGWREATSTGRGKARLGRRYMYSLRVRGGGARHLSARPAITRPGGMRCLV